MKVEHLRKLPVILMTVFLCLALSAPALAIKPYFKTYGSDVMSGGWFINNKTCDPSTYYQTAGYTNGALGISADDRTGGILAFAKELGGSNKADGGASSQYAAYSLGYVEHDNDPARIWGFYSDGANIGASTRADDLTFANQNSALPAAAWGGMFEGTAKQSHCIPDYYEQGTGATAVPSGTTLNGLASGNYSITAAAGTNYRLDDRVGGPIILNAGTRINIYVNGNVYIGNSISYGSSSADDAPKLRIVAKGSIYIDPSVQNLDGWYVAQPDMSLTPDQIINTDTGIIWTCHADNASITDVYITTNCINKLTINGALTAKKVNLVRLKGDITGASTAEDSLLGSAGGNIAEVVNFSAAMVVGGGFTGGSSGGGPLPIDSIKSLPPIF